MPVNRPENEALQPDEEGEREPFLAARKLGKGHADREQDAHGREEELEVLTQDHPDSP